MDENGNGFPPLPPSALSTLFEMPEFTSLPFDKRREKLAGALSAVYDYSASQPDFKDEDAADFHGLAQRAYDKLDQTHTTGERVGEAGRWLGETAKSIGKDVLAVGSAAVSAASQLEPGGVDPTKGAAQAWGQGFGVGSAKLIDSALQVSDAWFSDKDNALKTALGDVREQIDTGKAPVTDPEKFTGWLKEQSDKVLVPQQQWSATRLSFYAPDYELRALKAAQENPLSSGRNAGLLGAYIKTRDPKIWDQLEKNLVTTPLAAQFGDLAKGVTDSESGKELNKVFNTDVSQHLLSSSDPVMVASYLIPGARAAMLGKTVLGGAGKAAVAGSLATGAAEQAGIGAAATLSAEPASSGLDVLKGAGEMVALGAAIHTAGALTGVAVREMRAAAPDIGTAQQVNKIVNLANKAAEPTTPITVAEAAEPTVVPPVPLVEPEGMAARRQAAEQPAPLGERRQGIDQPAPVGEERQTIETPSPIEPIPSPEPDVPLAERQVTEEPAPIAEQRQGIEEPTPIGERRGVEPVKTPALPAPTPFPTPVARTTSENDNAGVAPEPVDITNLRKIASSNTLGESALRQELKAHTPEERASIAQQLGTEDTSPVALAKALKFGSDWTRATEEAPAPAPAPKATAEGGTAGIAKLRADEPMELSAGVSLPKFDIRKVTELDKATMERSSTIQRSTQETDKMERDLKKAVPSEDRRKAIAMWRDVGGDTALLAAQEKTAKTAWFKKYAKIAQNLTPEEMAVGRVVANTFDTMEVRGKANDVLKDHRDNYIPHVWNVENPSKGFGTRSLKKNLAFAKARTLDNFFAGDQAGFSEPTLDIAKLGPGYVAEMNRVIADRKFTADVIAGSSKEGTPLAIPRGYVTTLDGKDVAHLVHPNGVNVVKDASGNVIDQSKYKVMPDQPALRTWRWRGKDTESNPIMLQGDLALHPEAYRRINAMMGESPARKWYRDTEGPLQIPKAFARAVDVTQSAVKREMFGLLPPFHQVQEGTHAIGHLVNPFWGLKEFDLNSAEGRDAARYTMLLSDKTSGRQYFEGVGAHKTLITSAARKFGGPAGRAVADVIEGYQKYVFGSYIPRLKYNTYLKIAERNAKRFAPELKAGTVTPEDVKLLSGQQTDAAYGHLNYAMLDRSPGFQHFLQLSLLAPDFLEARGRFVAQAAKSITSKVGNEQLKAIAVLAATQAGVAFTLSQLTGGQWDWKHPFEFTRNGRKFTMRSVPEDLFRAGAVLGGDWDTTRQFGAARINPAVQTGVQLAFGTNPRGEKVTPLQTLEEAVAKFIPLTIRSLPGIRNLTETSRNSPVSPLEQFAGSVGLKISRASPITDAYKLADAFMKKQGIPPDTGVYPVSKYRPLRFALEDSDPVAAKAAYDTLSKTMSRAKIIQGFHESVTHPFTQNKAMDLKLRASLSEEDKAIFDLAKKKRQDILARFRLMPKR